MANSSRREDSLKPQAREVLKMLRAAGDRGVSNGDFIRAYIERFGGRICEMRKLGWEIETVREGQGRSRYFLRGEPSGLGAGGPLPGPTASVEPGEHDPARPTPAHSHMAEPLGEQGPSRSQTAAARLGEAEMPLGGGALFDAEDFAPRRTYATEELAA
jgi:hypothetical protein